MIDAADVGVVLRQNIERSTAETGCPDFPVTCVPQAAAQSPVVVGAAHSGVVPRQLGTELGGLRRPADQPNAEGVPGADHQRLEVTGAADSDVVADQLGE
jgi:hypothetical protein